MIFIDNLLQRYRDLIVRERAILKMLRKLRIMHSKYGRGLGSDGRELK
jgi:hypothetical protein